MLAAHGTGGRGCDVCKPAVASILASQLGHHVLEGANATVQDTNDAYLANIQRNGTYSVVPRIPGGEVTPEGLIVIGEVARDFGLYTKITGGQRIDLFGARMEQLPAIWRRLVDAGFESGHAYGKSLRTVKSCVGSTWCRYGVQDSDAARDRPRAALPRACARRTSSRAASPAAPASAPRRAARTSASSPPRRAGTSTSAATAAPPRVHARLLAGDLDTETLVRYLDRFLMYYVRTADRLQRTAPWVDSLDGGLDRVRAVVVDDVLGLGSELEAAMARHVDGYFDEWRATLDDPDKLRRFVSFVNAPDVPDPHITFREERGQIGPGRPDRPRVASAPRSRSAPRERARIGCATSLRRRLPPRRHRTRERRAGAGGRRGGRGLPHPRRRGARAVQLRPRSGGPACSRVGSWARGAARRTSPRRCSSRATTCAPGSASTTRRCACRRTTSA